LTSPNLNQQFQLHSPHILLPVRQQTYPRHSFHKGSQRRSLHQLAQPRMQSILQHLKQNTDRRCKAGKPKTFQNLEYTDPLGTEHNPWLSQGRYRVYLRCMKRSQSQPLPVLHRQHTGQQNTACRKSAHPHLCTFLPHRRHKAWRGPRQNRTDLPRMLCMQQRRMYQPQRSNHCCMMCKATTGPYRHRSGPQHTSRMLLTPQQHTVRCCRSHTLSLHCSPGPSQHHTVQPRSLCSSLLRQASTVRQCTGHTGIRHHCPGQHTQSRSRCKRSARMQSTDLPSMTHKQWLH
jgi:hypothetical protein